MTNIPGAGCNKRYSSKSAGCSEKARTHKMPQERKKTNMNQHFICMIYPVAVNGCGGENIFSDLWQLSSACVSANEQQSPPTNSLRDGRGGDKKKNWQHDQTHTHPAIQILIMDMQTEEQPQTDCSGANTPSQHKKMCFSY